MSDNLFLRNNGIDVVPDQHMEDGRGIQIGRKFYLSTSDYNALKKNLDMQSTRWGRFQLWLKRVKKYWKIK